MTLAPDIVVPDDAAALTATVPGRAWTSPEDLAARWTAARRPFALDEIELLPKPIIKDAKNGRCSQPDRDGICCGGWHQLPAVHLKYVGHAGITRRLNEVDPHWSWRPAQVAVDKDMLALAIQAGNMDMAKMLMDNAPPLLVGGTMWAYLTVLDKTVLCVGDAKGKTGTDATKELIGDMIRNGAMRLGIGLELWSKSERAQAIVARGDGITDEDVASAEATEQRRAEREAQASRDRAEREQRRTRREPAGQAASAAPPQEPAAVDQDLADKADEHALTAAKEKDADKLRDLWRQVGPALRDIHVDRVLIDSHAPALDAFVAAGHLNPRQALTLGVWIGACVKHIAATGHPAATITATTQGD